VALRGEAAKTVRAVEAKEIKGILLIEAPGKAGAWTKDMQA